MIDKPTIIVTSLGRTGTLYWARLFRDIFPEGTSLHEPDIFTFSPSQGKGWAYAYQQIKESGFINKVVKKTVGRWSLVELSDRRMRGQLSDSETVRRIRLQRTGFVAGRPGPVYCEATTAYYGLLDLLPQMFSRHRASFIVRDGREWVRSWMNWGQKGGMYSKGPLRKLIAHSWPGAGDLPTDPYHNEWPRMDRFEKLCWAWSRLNRFGIEAAEKNPDARVVRFEDIFHGKRPEDRLWEFIEWLARWAKQAGIPPRRLSGERFRRKEHESGGEFPEWTQWSAWQKKRFVEICGETMTEMGYEL